MINALFVFLVIFDQACLFHNNVSENKLIIFSAFV